ncbi:MAG: helix-turn-helix domain-containing protein [Pseudomonadales bacterium]|nr:helix-turn-helix domain-containing protein [Chlamydiia bacterium]MCB1656598.1 helix-turn-helix domain-containing protein [Pseudomonadales bacterium]
MNNKKSRPPSPAEMLKNELEKRNLSQRALAEKLGGTWTPPKVSDIISGKRGISESSALDLEIALKIPAEKWLKCQMERRLWEERRRRENAL